MVMVVTLWSLLNCHTRSLARSLALAPAFGSPPRDTLIKSSGFENRLCKLISAVKFASKTCFACMKMLLCNTIRYTFQIQGLKIRQTPVELSFRRLVVVHLANISHNATFRRLRAIRGHVC